MVNRIFHILVWSLLLLLLALSSHAVFRTVEGTVTKVADGDTITVVTAEGTQLRTRLYGIDAPEIRHGKKPGQPYGDDAKRALVGMVVGKKVRLDIIGVDRYKRMVAMVLLNGKNLNEQMVRLGWRSRCKRLPGTPWANIDELM